MVSGSRSDEVHVSGLEGLELLEALASRTRMRILNALANRSLDISTVARQLRLGESAVSSEVSLLEKVGLLEISYGKGKHGIRKICRLVKKRVCVELG